MAGGIDWGMANQGQYDYLQSLQGLGQAALQQQSLKQQQYGFNQTQARDQARPQIQSLIQAGNLDQARSTAFGVGDEGAIDYVKGLKDEHRVQIANESAMLGRAATSLIGVPQEQRASVLASLAPQLKAAGFSDEELAAADLSDASLRGYISLATDTKTALDSYNKAQEPFTLVDGATRYGPGGNVIANNAKEAPRPTWDSARGGWVYPPSANSPNGSMTSLGGSAPGQSAPNSAAALAPYLTAQESSGNYSAVGPQTQYGQALGGNQLLPNTAKGMADKLGLPWRPDLLTSATPQGKQYQDALSQAYLQEGFDKFGNARDALRYYHGGPDTRLWGPKTNAYADAVLRRAGQTTAPQGQQAQGQSVPGPGGGFVPVVPPHPRDAPIGYRYTADGNRLEPIPGGPADPSTPTTRNVQSTRKTEMDFRKEFDNLPEVKSFKTARTQYNTLRSTAMNPNATPADDISSVFTFMKTLDPNSTVREGEFATAQNAAGVPDRIRNYWNQVQKGTRLTPQQRQDMTRTAYRAYSALRDQYNQTAENYRGYARDADVSPDRVARTYTPDRPAPEPAATPSAGWGKVQVQP